MAISYLGGGGLQNDTSTATIVASYSPNVTAGSLLVAAFSFDFGSSATVTSVTDNRGNSWTVMTPHPDTVYSQGFVMAYAMNAAAGATTVTGNLSPAASVRRMVIAEYSGVAASAALDVQTGAFGACTAAADGASTGAVTTTADGDLIVGGFMDTGAASDAVSAGTGYTKRGGYGGIFLEDLVQNTKGSKAATATFASASRFAGGLAAFKAAAPAPPVLTTVARVNVGGILKDYTGRINLVGVLHPFTSKASDPTPIAVTATPSPSDPVISPLDYGAVCDGVTDDRLAVANALDYLDSIGGGTLLMPDSNCRMVQTASSVYTGIGANIAIVGAGPNSQISLACTGGGYNEMFRVSGTNVIFQDIKLVRVTSCSGIMIALHPPFSAFTMKNVVLDGASNLGGGMSGIIQPNLPSGSYGDIRLVGTTIKNFNDYGYFQPNEAQTSTDGIIIDGCTFDGNGADDLEFNAPLGVMQNLTIKNSTFSNNQSTATSAGFAIGLANAQHVLISNNTFDTYQYEPLHIEDRTSDVTIEDNTFTNSALTATDWSSHIFIISGATFVTIKRNHFDTTPNSNQTWVIYMGPGGPSEPYPSDITIQDNTFILGPNSSMTYDPGIARLVVSGNTVLP